MKTQFEIPEVKVIAFLTEDVLSLSSGEGDGDTGSWKDWQ